MRFFWDTSAAINAAVSCKVKARLEADEHLARAHLFSEFFSVMTGRGIPGKDTDGNPVRVTFDADDAARWLRDFAAKVRLVELDGAEILDALELARSRSVQGARVYDYAHALAAIKCNAEVVLTRNTKDFKGLTGSARLEWP
jgi:hypothetical protein